MFSDNLKYLRTQKGLSQEETGNELGLKRSTYRDYENGSNEPNLAVLQTIADYFNVGIDDLIRKDLSIVKGNLNTPILEQDFRVLAISVDKDQKENIEFVPVKAKAGYMAGYGNPDFIMQLQRFNLPTMPTGTFRAFEISGDSMPPLAQGAIVIGKYVENWRDIQNLKTYVLITKNEGLVYKRVINQVKEKGRLLLMSDNHIYEPYTIPITEVLEIWSYYAHMSFGYEKPDVENQIMHKLEAMGGEIENISELLKKKYLD